MRGRRVEYKPGFPGPHGQPGDYCKVPDGMDIRGPGVWYVIDPTGKAGALIPSNHRVTEHEDGTISVSPSLVMKTGYHGFLRRGEWS